MILQDISYKPIHHSQNRKNWDIIVKSRPGLCLNFAQAWLKTVGVTSLVFNWRSEIPERYLTDVFFLTRLFSIVSYMQRDFSYSGLSTHFSLTVQYRHKTIKKCTHYNIQRSLWYGLKTFWQSHRSTVKDRESWQSTFRVP